jgi:hypothetical protein
MYWNFDGIDGVIQNQSSTKVKNVGAISIWIPHKPLWHSAHKRNFILYLNDTHWNISREEDVTVSSQNV